MKRAVSGRSLERESFWRTQIQAQPTSGLSVRAFCRQRELREPSFYHWRRTLATRDGKPAGPAQAQRDRHAQPNTKRKAARATSLVPVVIGPNRFSPTKIEMVLTGGTTLRLSDPLDVGQLQQVLEVLRQHEAEPTR